MTEFLLEFPKWQWLATAAAFLLFAGVEFLVPRRAQGQGRWRIWLVNLSLYGLVTAAVVLSSPLILKGAAGLQSLVGFPPLVQLGLPAWLLVLVSFLLIDLMAYLLHASFHSFSALWRVHQVHHSDPMLDASTGVRHHPIEALVGGCVQLTLFAVLGLPLLVVLAYGVVMTLWQFFTHANYLPEPIDRLARLVLVTPGMHVVHHSVRPEEGNSNFGMLLSIWDRLFGTYRRRSVSERQTMALGLEDEQEAYGLGRLLILFLYR